MKAVVAQLGLAAAVMLAGGPLAARTNECVADCEATYKTCATNRRQSESACRTALEKCRKVCLKRLDEGDTDNAPPAPAAPPKPKT